MDAVQVRTQRVKEIAISEGFSHVGIASAKRLDDQAEKLKHWLNLGYHGKMSYMENHFDKRVDPERLVPGAKSIISLLYNYYTPVRQVDPDAPKISMYAYGKDYHKVIKTKLKSLFNKIKSEFGELSGRCFVDSAPVLESEWAALAGMGWKGKNTLLINPRAGSYFFISEIILDFDLYPDEPISDHCGTCTRCIDACPTSAISPQGYVLDGSKCISYLTIELRDAIPVEFSDKMENWMFGCDICQEVCPWNRFSEKHQEDDFEPSNELIEMKKSDWKEITEEVFGKIFRDSAVQRTKYEGLRRNIDFLTR